MTAREWEYRPAPDLEKGLEERLRDFPREPDLMAYALRSAAALALRAWLRTYHRLRIIGRENLPAEGSFVLVGNHASHLDALCLTASLPLKQLHRAFPAAAADYFFSSFARSVFSAVLINALPFDREVKGEESLSVCARLLANPGNVLVLFPEGTRSPSGELGRFRSGIGRLVTGTSIPVVPSHLSGAAAAWPKGRAFPRPQPLCLRIGAPRSYEELSPSRESVRGTCEDLHDAVAELGRCGREPSP